jgi:NitT/TauT family transport system substrate-binding protein
VRRMQAWLYQHSADDLAEVVAPFYPDLAPDLLTNALGRYRDAGLWARYPEVSREGFSRLAESPLSGAFVSRLHAHDDCVAQSLREPV